MQYFVLANHYWFFGEALYLHSVLIASVFMDNNNCLPYGLLGWGMCLYEATECVCVGINTYTHIHTHSCIYTRTHAHTHTNTHTHRYFLDLCMCVCVCALPK